MRSNNNDISKFSDKTIEHNIVEILVEKGETNADKVVEAVNESSACDPLKQPDCYTIPLEGGGSSLPRPSTDYC